MKKCIVLLTVLVLCLLCGCNQTPAEGDMTPTDGATAPSSPEQNEEETIKQPDWEMPIDVDDPADNTAAETEADATKPDASEPAAESATQGYKPEASDAPTQGVTEPEKPSESSGPISLPMIPG